MTFLVKIAIIYIDVRRHYILCFTHRAYHCALGLCMAACGAQNTAHANIESRIASVLPFRYLGHVKNHGVVITLASFMLSSESFGDFTSLVHQSFENLDYTGS